MALNYTLLLRSLFRVDFYYGFRLKACSKKSLNGNREPARGREINSHGASRRCAFVPRRQFFRAAENRENSFAVFISAMYVSRPRNKPLFTVEITAFLRMSCRSFGQMKRSSVTRAPIMQIGSRIIKFRICSFVLHT